MRLLFTFAALALLAACASASPQASRADFSGVASAAVLSGAGGPAAITFEQAQRMFGPADVVRREGAGGLLSYRLPGCALALGFARDRAGELRLSVVEAGPPTPRGAPPSLAQCAAAAETRKRRGAGA